jgi:diacylglycerol O-acyltransferase 1
MSLTTDTATVTSRESPAESPIKRPARSHGSRISFSSLQPLQPIRVHRKRKYRHIAAVHSAPKASCLSHDSDAAPSFLGFRNLMVIVLSMSAKNTPTAAPLALENWS